MSKRGLSTRITLTVNGEEAEVNINVNARYKLFALKSNVQQLRCSTFLVDVLNRLTNL